MLKTGLFAFAVALAGSAVAQTPPSPATPATPATPPAPVAAAPTEATSGAGTAAALPRCSAEIRDRCLQDERFASDVARPGGSRDNNAMHYRTSTDAERGRPR